MFDYIIVDLPPLGPVVDVRAAGSLFDAFLFVVEWGRTPRIMVQNILASDNALYEKCVGVIFNKVNMQKSISTKTMDRRIITTVDIVSTITKTKFRRAGVGDPATDLRRWLRLSLSDPFCDRRCGRGACRFARWRCSPCNADVFDSAASIEKGALPDADYLARFVASNGLDRASIDCGDPFTRASLTVNLAALDAATKAIDAPLTDAAEKNAIRAAERRLECNPLDGNAWLQYAKARGERQRTGGVGYRRAARVLLGGAERGWIIEPRLAFATNLYLAGAAGFETEHLDDLRRFASFEVDEPSSPPPLSRRRRGCAR